MDVSKDLTGPVLNGFGVEKAPEYNMRRIRAVQKRMSSTYQKHLRARKLNVMYSGRVFKDRARKRNINIWCRLDLTSTAASFAQHAGNAVDMHSRDTRA